MSQPSLRRAGATVIILMIVTKVVGFVREAVVAGVYGTSRVVDVYLAAVIIPAIITSIVYQALPNALIPVFQPGQTPRHVKRLAISLLAISLGVSIIVWLTAPWTAAVTNAGFGPDAQADTVSLIQIAAAAILLATAEALGRSRLIAQRRFMQSGISQIWSSVTVIITIVLFPAAGAYALMWGLVIGTGIIALWNVLPLERHAGTSSIAAESLSSTVGDSGWLAVVVLVSSVGLLYGLIDRHLGSYLTAGSLAALQYASLIANQPVAICGIALAMAMFPYLSQKILADDRSGAATVLDRSVRWALLGVTPCAVFVVFFAPEILQILFERGAFDMQSRAVTGTVLAVYGFWMIPAVLSSVIAKVFYSNRGVRALVGATVIGLLIKLGASLWWVDQYGIAGLAASSAAALLAYYVLLTIALPGWLRIPLWRGWMRVIIVLTALTAAGSLLGRLASMAIPIPPGKLEAYIPIGVATVATVVLLILIAPMLGVEEPRRLIEMVRASVARRSGVSNGGENRPE